jgi:hypothetical protein
LSSKSTSSIPDSFKEDESSKKFCTLGLNDELDEFIYWIYRLNASQKFCDKKGNNEILPLNGSGGPDLHRLSSSSKGHGGWWLVDEGDYSSSSPSSNPCAWWMTSPLGTPRGRCDEYSSSFSLS